MSVKSIDRSEAPPTFVVRRVAREFYGKCIKVCANEKHMPKRLRWINAQRILDDAAAIKRELNMANSLRLDVSQLERDQRLLHQNMALGMCDDVLDEIDTANEVHPLGDQCLAGLVESVDELVALIHKWVKSDARRASS